MKLYELNYLIPDDFSEEQSKGLSERISILIQENGGTVQEVKPALRQNLNKPIKKRFAVFLITLNFMATPEKMGEIEKKVALEPEILRHSIALRLIKVEGKAPRRLIKKPQTLQETPKVDLKEIDKKLEEILGQ
jgi:ribosomal protein S6